MTRAALRRHLEGALDAPPPSGHSSFDTETVLLVARKRPSRDTSTPQALRARLLELDYRANMLRRAIGTR
jgi:hypothetical protein